MTIPIEDASSTARWPERGLRPFLVTLAVLIVLFGSLLAWRAVRTGAPVRGSAPAVAVAAVVVEPMEVPVSLEAVGTLRAVREVVLTPEVAGSVVDILFTAGATVRAGTLLLRLNDATEQADRRAAQARTAFADLQLQRSEGLAATGAQPRALLDQRRAERDQALAEVSQLDARLAQKQIRAPFAGQLGLRRVNLGQHLNPGDPVATLTALDSLYVEFGVPQQQLGRLVPGTAVTVAADAWPTRTFAGRVNAIETKIGAETRNVTVQAVIANADGALRPGMYVNVSLNLPPQSDALVVPATAIQTSAAGDTVVVVRGETPRNGGQAQIVPVTTGRRVGDTVVVTTGLQPGDVVVTEGQLRIQPGTKVTIARIGGGA